MFRRLAWVAVTATLDILDSIHHVRAELGYDGSAPPGFMSDDYVRSPSRYTVVPEYLDAAIPNSESKFRIPKIAWIGADARTDGWHNPCRAGGL